MVQRSRSIFTSPGARWRAGVLVATALPALALPALALRAQPARPATQPPARVTVIGPGPTNSLTDVPGLKVGHFTRSDSGYRSGTTVIRTEKGATAGYSQMGGAPGTKETDLLKPGGQVRTVQAIMLGGGSAFGLDAATGVMQWMEEHNFGVPVGGGVVPIVPAAILMDLGRGGNFKKRPDASFGYKATEAATTDPVQSGRIGVGMGAGWGMGTASVKLSNGYTVAAIVGLNPAGSPLDPRTCLPYGFFLELGDEFNLVQPRPRNAPRRPPVAVVRTTARTAPRATPPSRSWPPTPRCSTSRPSAWRRSPMRALPAPSVPFTALATGTRCSAWPRHCPPPK